MTVDTPRSQAVVGFGSAAKPQTRNLTLELKTPFSAVTLGALDGRPIVLSGRLLLTACARVANTRMEWDEKRRSLTSWGTAPTVIEPVTGVVVLRSLEGATGVTVQALDGGGRALGPRVAAGREDGWHLRLGDPATTWHLVTVER